MQTDEEKKARMRAYYQANKKKWKNYKRDRLARMTDAERAAFKEKQRHSSRQHYEAHREGIIQRTSKYNSSHRDNLREYQSKWFQENKHRIAAKKRQQYHSVVKPRRQKAKEASEFITVRQAVEKLGAKLRTFRQWVYQGRINSIRTPGGRYLLRRSDVEDIQNNVDHIPEKIRNTLGLLKKKGEA